MLLELIFPPTNPPDHWALLVITTKKETEDDWYLETTYYDSSEKHNNDAEWEMILKIFKKNAEEFNYKFNEEKSKVIQEKCPNQTDITSCGIFVIMVAQYIAQKQKIDFTHEHIRFFRRKIAIELLTGNLILKGGA